MHPGLHPYHSKPIVACSFAKCSVVACDFAKCPVDSGDKRFKFGVALRGSFPSLQIPSSRQWFLKIFTKACQNCSIFY